MRVHPELTPDDEFKWLGTEGYTGTINDRQSKYLKASGYTGALPDMLKKINNDYEFFLTSTGDNFSTSNDLLLKVST